MKSARDIAIMLRKQGYSYRHIAKVTGFSLSTLSYHLADIPYTPNSQTISHIGKARAAAGKTKSRIKKTSLEDAKKYASEKIGTLTERDLFMLGVGLYIGEGSKTQNLIRLVNMDHRVIRLYLQWLQSMGLKNKNFSIRLHLYPDSNILEAEQFWMKHTGLSKQQFQRPCIDRRVGKNMRKTSTYSHGTAHVTVKSLGQKEFGVILARRIGAYMQKVLESPDKSRV